VTLSTISAFNQDFTAYAGDNWQFDADIFTDENLTTPYDLTAFDEIEIQIRLRRTETGLPLVQDDLNGGLQVVDTNTLRVNVAGSKMEVLGPRVYQYDVEGRSATETKTIMQGSVTITGDVVR
jgi:hypothetical protein